MRHSKENISRQQIAEKVAQSWKNKFEQTPAFQSNISRPSEKIGAAQAMNSFKRHRLGIVAAIRQWFTLCLRYGEVLRRDKLNLIILFAQSPLIALMTFLVIDINQPRDFIYFILSLISIWFGVSIAAREIVRERVIFKRERMFNLGLLPYLSSKITVLGIIVIFQCLLVFVPLKLLDSVNLMRMPGIIFGIPQFFLMLLTAAVGIALGLLISASVKTSEMATSLVPLILIPQILFSGIVGIPTNSSNLVSLIMPAAWSFDAMKRFSRLETLEKEGAGDKGGLYQQIENETDKKIAEANKELKNYKMEAEGKIERFLDDSRLGRNPPAPTLGEPPVLGEPDKIPADLSHYVRFLNPWMNEIVNQTVLMLMFFILVFATLIVLRRQDFG